MTRLSVNLNKVALLRNQRDVGYPSVIDAARHVLDAGAHGVTIHPRPDERHIRTGDVREIADFLKGYPDKSIEFNIEGYPTDFFVDLVIKNKCDQVTLVPDAPSQKTSDHGWDMDSNRTLLEGIITKLHEYDRRVSLFIDPDPASIAAVKDVGADAVELFTGPYAFGEAPLEIYRKTAEAARKADLHVNGGHDLNLKNLGAFIEAIPWCAEVSIGHAITADALVMGWNSAVKAYLKAMEG